MATVCSLGANGLRAGSNRERNEAIHFLVRLLHCFVAYAPRNDGLCIPKTACIYVDAVPGSSKAKAAPCRMGVAPAAST